jgi:putative ABC transport system permease protein
VAVGATSVAPFGTWSTANRFRREDTPVGEYLSAAWRAVTPGFFGALGIPLVRGRFLEETDTNGSLEVVVITESMARRFWPDADPVGQRLSWGSSGRPKEIVGIVGDLRDVALDKDPQPTMFRPYSQLTPGAMTLLVRTAGDPAPLVSFVRREIRWLVSDVPLQLEPLRSALHGSIARPRAGAWAFLAFALLALALAGAGLFGLVAYDVTKRRREIAIRLALGASRGAVSWAVQRRGLRIVAVGAVLGLVGSLALSRVLGSLLYATSPTDVATHVGVGLLLVSVAAAASSLAARAALQVDPAEALRSE